ncbi:LysR family transcriptional regulator [Aestuariispira insulae]|nr:LysR family transcriptional regulator [Aestuariispira insulae]
MTSIDHFNLRSFDLNLMIAFDAMMKERSVTKAAAKLRIQQPAMSHNLSTLRMLLDDELFIRIGNVMQPTAKAEAIAVSVADILDRAQSVIQAKDCFNPACAEREFKVGFTCEELLLLPDLVARMAVSAPGIRIRAVRVFGDDVGRALDQGDIDLSVVCFPLVPARYRHQKLLNQTLACVYNPDLLAVSGAPSRTEYLAARHVFIALQDDIRGCVGTLIREAGFDLDIVVGVPDYMAALEIAAVSPMIATMPDLIASRYASRFGLAVHPAPVPIDLPSVSMVWSARGESDPAIQWLRAEITDIAAGITSEGRLLAAE